MGSDLGGARCTQMETHPLLCWGNQPHLAGGRPRVRMDRPRFTVCTGQRLGLRVPTGQALEPQFPHLEKGENSFYAMGCLKIKCDSSGSVPD